jgi:osmotically-inducible protein OsmY
MQEAAMTETITPGLHPIDLEIVTRVQRALDQHPEIPPTVCVHVGAGVAWLTGTAARRAARIEAERVVRRVAGVWRVVNQIVVAEPGADEDVERRRHNEALAVW